jgi:hypothetical protein
MLVDEMQTRSVGSPNTLLASPTTSLVLVRAVLPPGVKKDDRIDVQNGMPDADGNWIPDECEPSSKPFCEGDGPSNGGANCPCSINVPIGQIAGCMNSTGQGGTMIGSGNPSVSNDTFVLTDAAIVDKVSPAAMVCSAALSGRVLELGLSGLAGLGWLFGGFTLGVVPPVVAWPSFAISFRM